MRIAVAGNPNSGKTTLYNRITKSRARVGNYPGVTVEKREATRELHGRRVTLIDLPGCYSLTARSPEEDVAHHVLRGWMRQERPDVVICVVDATNLSRGLYLVTQLQELELPIVVALNMIDLAEAQGLHFDLARLSTQLGCPVVATSAKLGTGVETLLCTAVQGVAPSRPPHIPLELQDAQVVEEARRALTAAREADTFGDAAWLLTSNLADLTSPPTWRAIAERCQAELPEGFTRRFIAARYRRVDTVLEGVLDAQAVAAHPLSERLDRLLLHPVLGVVIFFVAMLVLFLAVFAWAEPFIGVIEATTGALAELLEDALPESLTRSLLVNGVLAGVGNVIVFLPQIALLFLGLTLLEESGYLARAAFLLDRLMRRVGLHGKSFVPLMSGFACAVPAIMASRTVESSRDRLVTLLVTPFMSCSARLPIYVLVVAAVFSGAPPLFGVLPLGGVVVASMYALGFLAALATAFLLKRTVLRSPPPPFILELPTYKLPQASEVMRRVAERCKVFIVSTGSVILALSVLLWALLTFPSRGLDEATFTAARLEAQTLPEEAQEAALTALEQRDKAARLANSLGGQLGKAIEPLIAPLGFDWRIGIGLVASFAAREVLVSTLGQVYALGADVEPDAPSLTSALLSEKDERGNPRFSPLVGVSLMVFFVLAMQCLSTVAAVRRETNSWRWPLAQLVYMNTLAYVASLAVFQTGRALGWG